MAVWAVRVLEREILLQEGDMFIGRDPDCHLPVGDALASRRHAVLHVARDQVTVEDLGSRNGTLLDGRVIGQPMVVTNLSKITIGTTTLTVLDLQSRSRRRETTPGAFTAAPRVPRKTASTSLPAITMQTTLTAGTNTGVPDIGFVERARDALLRGALDECAGAAAIVVRRQCILGARAIPSVVHDVSVVLIGLAQRTGDRGWLDGVFQVHAAAGRALHAELVDAIAALPGQGTVKHVREYIDKLRTRSASLNPEELVALERIERLASYQ